MLSLYIEYVQVSYLSFLKFFGRETGVELDLYREKEAETENLLSTDGGWPDGNDGQGWPNSTSS